MKWLIFIVVCVTPLALGYGRYGHYHQQVAQWDPHNSRPNRVQYTGLRVKYGPSAEQADRDYFFKIPRTIIAAQAEGWTETRKPPGPMPELRMFCPPGRGVCPLYDPEGFVAALQVALPVDDYQFLNPEKKFVLWHAPPMGREPIRDYWTLTQFYVSRDAFDSGEIPYEENGNTLQDKAVWVMGQGNFLTRIPLSEAALNASEFTRQHCLPNMGHHYYWRMGPNLNCDDLLPWFGITTKGQLIGVGFIMFGRLAPQQPRHYFEVPPSRDQISIPIIPDAPQCFWDRVEQYGMLTMHIYFVDDPWNIRCDS